MAKKEQKVLGKGLGALLGEVADVDSLRKPLGYVNRKVSEADVSMVAAKDIEANPYQPRLQFDEDKLSELAESIKTLGLIQPVTLRKKEDGKYQIISGERRYRACLKAGMDMIPSYVRKADDRAMIEMSIVENVQREDLDPIEVALSYSFLMEECQLTQEQVSERLGKKRASVANYLRLLRLPVKIQHDLRAGLISVGHAKVLLGVKSDQEQQRLCDAVIKDNLSVVELEKLLPSKKEDGMLQKVRQCLGKNASFRRNSSGKGCISISFDSDNELESFLKSVKAR